MSDLDLVRAEIKSWERDFASKHGRDPSVQDIKDQPAIADKYKLYKKLSKSLPKARQPDPVPPLPGFNPFSPTKKTRQSSHPGPFVTPTKSIPKSRPRLSPDPPHRASSSHALPVPTTAVSRARKRLRGEPVSPSPSKPKRQCIRSHALPTFPKLEQDSSNSGSDQELPRRDPSPSFVADSPVKVPAGGKSFKLLFDDALPALPIPKKLIGSSVARSGSSSDASFSRASADPTSRSVISDPVRRTIRTRSSIFPTKDHLPTSSHGPSSTVSSGLCQPRTSKKRALDSDSHTHANTEADVPLQPLVPPSPPPQDSARDTSRGKTKTAASRKKLRVDDEESDEEGDNLVTLKIATVGMNRDKPSRRHINDFDWDPLLHLGARNHNPDVMQQNGANHHASGTFNVDLPERFRRVLAISPSQSQDRTEERVVRELLYGDRVGHYDPSKGGVIWDAGEVDDPAYGDVESEDDWEGEPVPWEVGEL